MGEWNKEDFFYAQDFKIKTLSISKKNNNTDWITTKAKIIRKIKINIGLHQDAKCSWDIYLITFEIWNRSEYRLL